MRTTAGKPFKAKELTKTSSQLALPVPISGRLPKERGSATSGHLRDPFTFKKKKEGSGVSPFETQGTGRVATKTGGSPTKYPGLKSVTALSNGPSLNQFLQMMDQTKSKIKNKTNLTEKPFNSRVSAHPVLQNPSVQPRESPPTEVPSARPIKLLDYFANPQKYKPALTQASLPDFGQVDDQLPQRDSAPIKLANPMHYVMEKPDYDVYSKYSSSLATQPGNSHDQRLSLNSEAKTLSMPRTVLKVLFQELAAAAQRNEPKLVQFTINSIEAERTKESLRDFIDELDAKGKRLIHYAIRLQNEDLFYFLLAKNADFDLPDAFGITPLMMLASEPWPDVNQILVNAVRDCNVVDDNNNNVFHYAVLKKNLDLIQCLVDSREGLAVRQQNDDGLTPTDLADTAILVKVEGIFKKYERKKLPPEPIATEGLSESGRKSKVPRVAGEKSAYIHINFRGNQSGGEPKNVATTQSASKPGGKVLIRVDSDNDFDVYTNQQSGRGSSNSQAKASRRDGASQEYGMAKTGLFAKKRLPEDFVGSTANTKTAKRNLLLDKGLRTDRPLAPLASARDRPIANPASLPALLTDRPSLGQPKPKELPALAKQRTLKKNQETEDSGKAGRGIVSRQPALLPGRPQRGSNLASKLTQDRKPVVQLDISDFIVHSIIGTGSFGKVYLVQKRDTLAFYAMKTLCKEEIVKNNLKRYAMTERNVLHQITHPFIIKLRYSFQNPDYLFLIMDFMPGGDLGQYLERDGRFSERRARIYAAEVILAIAELHRHNIIFRDLKPDNILLDEDGHALLSDFGLSKENVRASNNEKSFCGTFAYLAPEMVKKTGHGKAMDWYLVGAFIFEMVTGIPPFYSDDKSELFHNIKSAELELPDSMSEELRSLLGQLLEKDPQKRIDLGAIQRHPWFREIDWGDVLHRRLLPPKPHIEKRKLNEIENVEGLFGSSRVSKLTIDNWTFIQDVDRQLGHP